MEKKHYQAAQYFFITLFIAFFVYVVSWRCDATLWGTLMCGPKVIALAVWFVISLIVLKISYVKIKKSTDVKEAALFWLINLIIVALYIAAFGILFVLNYI
jgi:hypothetical protein